MPDGADETSKTSGRAESTAAAGAAGYRAGERPAPEDGFDSALRSLADGTAASAGLREPSAADREKLARQARKKRERARKRYAKLEKKDAREARRTQRKASGRRSGGRAWGALPVAAALAAVAGGGLWLAGPHLHLRSLTGAGGPDDTQVVTNGPVPSISAPPITRYNVSGPPADPFAGTPADTWADGAAGIVIPAAKPAGDYSATQVKDAYQTTKKLLVAAALDRRTLLGGAPAAFARLLTRQQRSEFLSQLNHVGLRKDGTSLSSRGWIMSFAPGTTKLVGSAIKVHGVMTARATTDDHGLKVLEVHLNYLVSYPVEPPRAPADWMRVVAHFEGYVEFGHWAEADTAFEPWWQAGPSPAGARCGMADGYAHPDFPDGPPDKVRPSGPAIDPYALSQKDNGTCQTTTGT